MAMPPEVEEASSREKPPEKPSMPETLLRVTRWAAASVKVSAPEVPEAERLRAVKPEASSWAEVPRTQSMSSSAASAAGSRSVRLFMGRSPTVRGVQY
jgi:hypothetical protein